MKEGDVEFVKREDGKFDVLRVVKELEPVSVDILNKRIVMLSDNKLAIDEAIVKLNNFKSTIQLIK